jgi:hypothetical protein
MSATTFFDHNEIAAVLSDVVPFNNFLLNFFGSEHVTNDKQINFDKIDQDNRLAVFVNPMRPGEVVKDRGFQVNSYKPGYIKDKVTVSNDHVFTRRPGESMSTAMTPAQRYAATVIDLAVQQKERLYRRLELMAGQLLLGGSYTMTGVGHDVTVDFVRNTANTVTLAGVKTWLYTTNATTMSPIEDLEDWINLAVQPIRTAVIGQWAWKALRKDPKFDKLIYIDLMTRGQSGLEYGPQQKRLDGVTYRGTLASSGIEIYTYSRTYTDPATGTETQYLPQGSVVLVPANEYGWQCFASIQDSKANYMGMPYFFKNWEEDDPGIPFMMLQSAPMLAHTKINSTIGIATGATATGV